MSAAGRPLRIALVAPARFPVREPYAGGLESIVATLASALRTQGHQVELYAVRGSAGGSTRFAFPGIRWGRHDHASDVGYPPGGQEAEHQAFDELVQHLAAEGGHDVIHNHSLHPALLARAGELGAPLLTTVHTPPFPELQEVIARAVVEGRSCGHVAAVSRSVADAWVLPDSAEVIGNGIDLDDWPAGPGGDHLVWTGRLVPEKAPHLALETARAAGRPLRLAGRVGDDDYVRARVLPLLSSEHEYLGPLRRPELAALVGSSAAALVTPLWEEPFGLVVAEAMAAGTPVAALRRGGVPEVLGPWAQVCSTPVEDPRALARVVDRAVRLDRAAIRSDARGRLGADVMARAYVARYRDLAAAGVAG